MKILFVNEKCGYFGGVEQNIADCAEGLTTRGHECFLSYGELTDRRIDEYTGLFNKIYPTTGLGGTSSKQQEFAKIVADIRPDVIYLHKSPNLTFGDTLKNAPRTVRMVHDHDLCCPRRHKYYALNGRICHSPAGWKCWLDLAFLARGNGKLPVRFVDLSAVIREMRRNFQFDALLVGSRFMREELLMNGFPSEKISVVHPVVRMEESDPTPVPDDKHILYVGQLIRGKGVDLLLHALKALERKSEYDYSATIVGTGNAEDKLKKLAQELQLGERVYFKGWVPNRELGFHYKSATVLAVPSRWPEPFGMIGLEAMRYGRPVVGFDVGGIPDWLEHDVTGLLAPEQDTNALSRAIASIIKNNKLANKYGQNGYKALHEKFAFDTYLDNLETILKGDG